MPTRSVRWGLSRYVRRTSLFEQSGGIITLQLYQINPAFTVHTAWCLLLERQGRQVKVW